MIAFAKMLFTVIKVTLTGRIPVHAGCESDSSVVPGRCSTLQAGTADHCEEMELTFQTAPD